MNPVLRGAIVANGLLPIHDQGPWSILVTNTTLRSIHLARHTCLAMVQPDAEVISDDQDLLQPQADTPSLDHRPWQQHFADIRVNAPYLRYIETTLLIEKHLFPEAFYIGERLRSSTIVEHTAPLDQSAVEIVAHRRCQTTDGSAQ